MENVFYKWPIVNMEELYQIGLRLEADNARNIVFEEICIAKGELLCFPI